MLMRTYLQNNDAAVVFGTIDKPDLTYKKLDDPLKAALKHEQFITGCINKIYAAADKAKDYRTMQFFDWFVKEQGEEEKNRQRPDQEIRTVRQRSQRALRPEPGTPGQSLRRTDPGALRKGAVAWATAP